MFGRNETTPIHPNDKSLGILGRYYKKNDSCATCGKAFCQKEMKVSYDFERFYCVSCDDKR